MTARAKDVPTGTVTFLFSDVQDSTARLQRPASAQHLDLFDRIIEFQKRAGRLMDVAHT